MNMHKNVYLVLNPNTVLLSQQYHCWFDDFFESVRFQSPELNVPTTWQSLSKLTCDNTSTPWEPQEDVEAKYSNASGAADTQGEADPFTPDSNHFEQDKGNQAPPCTIQDATVEDEPIARRTQGRLQQEKFVANEATNDGELGESAAD